MVAILALIAISSTVFAQAPDSLSFQGFLTDDMGNPIDSTGLSITFNLYKGTTSIWMETQSVDVDSGVFNVYLGAVTAMDTVAFNQAIDLGIKVGADPEMSPRTPLAAAAYAKALPGLYTFYREDAQHKSYNVVGGGANNVVGSGVVGATIGGGGGIWNNSQFPNRVLAEFATVGGGAGNTASGARGTVGGGFRNTASSDRSTVGGGQSNTASGSMATVGGGQSNTASTQAATVGGGERNTASGFKATVGGGIDNTASAFGAVVGGGRRNTASRDWATVPGGLENSARGLMSFAAGHDAKAIHDGTFVWNDRSIVSGKDSLLSTGPNQFLIRAAGGVGIGTNQPLNGSQLHVEHGSMGVNDWGFVLSNVFSTNGSTSWRTGMRMSNGGFFEITDKANINSPNFARLDSGGNWTVVSDRRRKTGIEPASDLLKAALELEPVRFYWKNQNERGGKSLGMIAQQVQEVVPSLVIAGDPLTLNYAGLSVVAIGAIQELHELLQDQQAIIETQNARIARLEAAMGSR